MYLCVCVSVCLCVCVCVWFGFSKKDFKRLRAFDVRLKVLFQKNPEKEGKLQVLLLGLCRGGRMRVRLRVEARIGVMGLGFLQDNLALGTLRAT